MMKREVDSPDVVSSPFYAQSVEVTEARRLLFVSGQVPWTKDRQVPEGFEDQARLAWSNLFAQLRAAGMGPENLVKVTIFLSDRAHVEGHRTVYDEVLAGRRIAVSTIVAGTVEQPWHIEIEGFAAA
jgi:enamine deaminase RidA (YjgF/YER057c/UK114 family)